MPSRPVLYVDSTNAVADLCERLRASGRVALDTEFIRERTYYPRLCLLQLADEALVACVDPLALGDLGPLLDLLYDPNILKIMHAARQDFEILAELRGEPPAGLFDTQVAATLLGHGDQIGYGPLVEAELGVSLAKGHARTDWSRRPLESGQLAYAADDVRYLLALHDRQHARLRELGREAWLREDVALLSDPQLYRRAPDEAWQRLRGASALSGVQRAVLQELAAWREERAMHADRPRRWVLGDDALLGLAYRMPVDKAGLARVRELEEGTIKRHGETLLELIQSARELPPEQWPAPTGRLPLTTQQTALVGALMEVVRQCGERLGVSPPALAPRAEMERFVLAGGEGSLRGWREDVIGAELRAAYARLFSQGEGK